MPPIVRLLSTLVCLSLVLAAPLRAEGLTTDAAGARDPDGLPRFAGSVILGYQSGAQERSLIPTGRWTGAQQGKAPWASAVEVAGERTRLVYLAPRGVRPAEVMAHYRGLLEGLGSQALFNCSGFHACGADVAAFYADKSQGRMPAGNHLLRYVYSGRSVQDPELYAGRLTLGGAERYVLVFAAYQDNYADAEAGDRVAVFVEQVIGKPAPAAEAPRDEPEPAQPAAAPRDPTGPTSAAELAKRIAEEGRAVVYGIRMEGAKLAPTSRQQVDEIVALLGEQPDLALYVVGHSDDRGTLDETLERSRRAASAVVKLLVRDHRIPVARLTAQGVGCLAPVASNATEEGRARNRRLELVPR